MDHSAVAECSGYNPSMPREALSLPEEQRAALIDSLFESLDSEVDEDAEEASRQEIYAAFSKSIPEPCN